MNTRVINENTPVNRLTTNQIRDGFYTVETDWRVIATVERQLFASRPWEVQYEDGSITQYASLENALDKIYAKHEQEERL